MSKKKKSFSIETKGGDTVFCFSSEEGVTLAVSEGVSAHMATLTAKEVDAVINALKRERKAFMTSEGKE